MPTIFSHPAVPLAIGIGLGHEVISKRLLIFGIICCILPDLDVVAFYFGIPYYSQWGHRGFSHSLFFALVMAIIGAAFAKKLSSTPAIAFWFLLVVTASHGILDSFTNGGLGITFLWPFLPERYFAPVQPIEVSPLSLSGILSRRGVSVIWSEILWVWLPCLVALAMTVIYRHRRLLTTQGRQSRHGD